MDREGLGLGGSGKNSTSMTETDRTFDRVLDFFKKKIKDMSLNDDEETIR